MTREPVLGLPSKTLPLEWLNGLNGFTGQVSFPWDVS